MTRLTNDIRESIRKDILRHRFRKPVDALVEKRALIANKCYHRLYPKEIQERMEALPKGWLPSVGSIGVQVGDDGSRFHQMAFNGGFYSTPFSPIQTHRDQVELLMQYRHRSGCAIRLDMDDPISTEWFVMMNEMNDLYKAIEAAKSSIIYALRSVTTTKRLIEVWPEVAAFAKEYDDIPAKVPAIPRQTLNEALHLPPA